jgi:hypothetical protein
MSTQTQVPPQVAALDELRAQATTPEEHAYLDAEAAQIAAERAEILGHVAIGELTLQDGVVVEKHAVDAQRDAGQAVGGSSWRNAGH